MVLHFGAMGTHDPVLDPDPAVLVEFLRSLGMDVEDPGARLRGSGARQREDRWVPVRRAGRTVSR